MLVKKCHWAADKKRNSNFKIEDARKAYNNFENSGITTLIEMVCNN